MDTSFCWYDDGGFGGECGAMDCALLVGMTVEGLKFGVGCGIVVFE